MSAPPPPPPPGRPPNYMRPHAQVRSQMPPAMGYNQMNRPYMNNSQMNIRAPNPYTQNRPMQPQQPRPFGMQRFQRPPNRPMYPNQQETMQQYNNPGGYQPDGASQASKGQLQRTTIDYYGSWLHGLEMRNSGAKVSVKGLPADPSYTVDVPTPAFIPDEPETSMATRFVQQAINKIKSPINVAKWTPEGRRLITGSSRGELTLWNGLSFNFETIMTPNLSNLKVIQGHKYPVRDLSFSPTDLKFVSASDDQQLKIWDFRTNKEERQLVGHKWDVRTVDWHPRLGMIASGSKDSMVRIWDPRSAKCLATLRQHGQTVTQVEWNRNGQWLLTGSRDHSIKLFDIRKLSEPVSTFVTQREVHSIAWHPIHETMFASGGSLSESKEMISEGSIEFWMTDKTRPRATVEGAHASQIWSLDWHPLGHILASGSNDKTTRFWCRPRPGEHLPTQLGEGEVDDRIFSSTVNSKAAAKLASHNERNEEKEASPAASADSAKPAANLPGLQSADIGRMLAKIKQSGMPGLPGLSKPGLPGLGPQRPPPPPPPHQPGPARNESRTRQSRFNPLQRNQSGSH
ncbi:WD repeat-containing protein 33 [Coemansia sp. RSA 989]|nr:WD repeat-containing protein 33 [Coemansia sp. RSA 1821]KAJ1866192.1 WD repeat-containing protein 33 [Coemansia sp. RSA 989]